MAGEIQLPYNLQISENAGFHVLRDFIIRSFSESYLDRMVSVCKREFAKIGVMNWTPSDANIVIDVVPMPSPWEGQWGYRIRCCAIMSNDEAHINQFYIPMSNIPAFQRGDMSHLN